MTGPVPPPAPAPHGLAAYAATTSRRAAADPAPAHDGPAGGPREQAPPPPARAHAGAPDPSGHSGGLIDVFA